MRQQATPKEQSQTTVLPATANGGPFRPTPGPRLEELGFDGGYKSFRLRRGELEHYDRRLEFWDGATETAMVSEDVSPFHERPSHRLAALAERIAAVRGKAIVCFGTMSLTLLGDDGRPTRMMEADQTLYLHPEQPRIVGPERMVVGQNQYPDVVLEVDRTTDVRRHKLKLYEAWGFPELWVDVPDQSPRPAAGLRPGMTIYARNDCKPDKLEVVAESRAFPGWTAEQIHTALNEEELSPQTVQCLERLGAVLGEREGTGPDDDLMLRSLRDKARAEALAAGRAAGLAQGMAQGLAEAFETELERRASMVRAVMIARGLEVAADFPLHEPIFRDADVDDAGLAALSCADEEDFVARLLQAAYR